MPGFLLHEGATVLCAHAPGQATPAVTNPRVSVSGQKIVTKSSQYTISGCALASSGTVPPCATAQWITAAVRVKAGGIEVLLKDSQSTCIPTGTPLNVSVTQVRVKGQ